MILSLCYSFTYYGALILCISTSVVLFNVYKGNGSIPGPVTSLFNIDFCYKASLIIVAQ